MVKALTAKIDEGDEEKFVPASATISDAEKKSINEEPGKENYKEYIATADTTMPTYQEAEDNDKTTRAKNKNSKSRNSGSETAKHKTVYA